METSRISFGEMIAAVSGVALFVFMLVDWYGFDVETGLGFSTEAGGLNAWQSFGLIDLILFLVCLVAIGMATLRAMGAMPELPWPPGLVVTVAGAIAVVLIVFRLLVDPFGADDTGGADVDVSRRIGIFLSLLAAAGITFGGFTSMNERASGTAPPA